MFWHSGNLSAIGARYQSYVAFGATTGLGIIYLRRTQMLCPTYNLRYHDIP